MPDSMNRTTEREISEAVLIILSKLASGSASYANLTKAVPTVIPLTAEDLVASDTRPNEAVWEQRLRNITSHKKGDGNYINDGYLSEIPGGLSITGAGLARAGQI
ncbi:hypothetical protein [Brucella anthropi]|uniref:hypothetical protein n=1 Tax=Brucella anthropi TaxID=529 RepID=UPI00241F5822|nr:hypothetical protein [Brucella anthropi]MDG9793040.1 hypothetical protein [Brucella anthropi]MDH0580198.1 hypothetical protein [Brucella anthropi]MDH0816822.1 hypothetical protein [Brucella anthropi]MDH2083354.1 hypothetical protein [Brucella anthropi]